MSGGWQTTTLQGPPSLPARVSAHTLTAFLSAAAAGRLTLAPVVLEQLASELVHESSAGCMPGAPAEPTPAAAAAAAGSAEQQQGRKRWQRRCSCNSSLPALGAQLILAVWPCSSSSSWPNPRMTLLLPLGHLPSCVCPALRSGMSCAAWRVSSSTSSAPGTVCCSAGLWAEAAPACSPACFTLYSSSCPSVCISCPRTVLHSCCGVAHG